MLFDRLYTEAVLQAAVRHAKYDGPLSGELAIEVLFRLAVAQVRRVPLARKKAEFLFGAAAPRARMCITKITDDAIAAGEDFPRLFRAVEKEALIKLYEPHHRKVLKAWFAKHVLEVMGVLQGKEAKTVAKPFRDRRLEPPFAFLAAHTHVMCEVQFACESFLQHFYIPPTLWNVEQMVRAWERFLRRRDDEGEK